MAMNKEERLLIEYRPKYGYRPDILAIIESMGSDASASTHIFPTELQEALANPAGPVLKEGLKLLDDFDGFLDELEAKLADDTAGGISFQDYLEARRKNDASTIMAYESMHRNSMDGKIEAELYPLLSHVRDSLAESMRFLNEQAFYEESNENTAPGSAFNRVSGNIKEKEAKRKQEELAGASVFLQSLQDTFGNSGTYGSGVTGTKDSYNGNSYAGPSSSLDEKRQQELKSYYDNPGAMMDREARELDALVRSDLKDGISNKDLAKLKTKTEIVQAVEAGLAAKQEFLNDAKVLTRQTLNDAFAAGAIGEAPEGEPDENMETYLAQRAGQGEDTMSGEEASMFAPSDTASNETPSYVGVENVVENLADASEAAISGTGKMLSIVHAKLAADMEDLSERQTKLYGRLTLKTIHDEIDRLRKLAVESEETLSWMEGVETNFEQSSIVDVITRNVTGVHMVLDGYEESLLDLRKMNNLSQMQNDDVVNTLTDKDVTRKSYNVISDMKENYMPGTANAAKNFVNNMGYGKTSVVKTKAKARASGSLNREDRR